MRFNDCHVRLGQAHALLERAEERDARALGDAIAKGESDPGPTHLNAAQAEVAEAKRRADGAHWARIEASNTAFQALTVADREAMAAEVNRRAVDAADRAKAALADVSDAVWKAHAMRDWRRSSSRSRNRPDGLVNFDADTLRHSTSAVAAVIANLAPDAFLRRLGVGV